MIKCCKTCNNHNATCHTDCSQYLTEKREHDRQQAEIKKVKSVYQEARSHARDVYDKIKRKNGR